MLIKVTQNLCKSITCSWKITKHSIPSKDTYNIVSVVFFVKNEPYKDISKYVNGLTGIVNKFNKILPTFRLRIYHDFSSLEIIKQILMKSDIIEEFIELYEYDINFFKEKDQPYHVGTIGTIIRFLPLFNLEHHQVDKCLVFDIDNVFRNDVKNIINFADDNNVKLLYRSRFCYIGKHIMCTNDDTIKYPLIASFIYQTISINYNILGNFFEDLYINNDIKLIKLIKDCNIISKFEYGIDEIFMNAIYLKYFYKNKILIAPILFNHIDISTGIINYFNYINNDQEFELYQNFVCNFFKIININFDIELSKDLLIKKIEDNQQKITKEINNIFYNKSLKYKILQFIKNISNNTKYNKLFKFNILLTCITNCLTYINIKMINILLLSTDYTTKAIVTNIEKKMIKYSN